MWVCPHHLIHWVLSSPPLKHFLNPPILSNPTVPVIIQRTIFSPPRFQKSSDSLLSFSISILASSNPLSTLQPGRWFWNTNLIPSLPCLKFFRDSPHTEIRDQIPSWGLRRPSGTWLPRSLYHLLSASISHPPDTLNGFQILEHTLLSPTSKPLYTLVPPPSTLPSVFSICVFSHFLLKKISSENLPSFLHLSQVSHWQAPRTLHFPWYDM